MKILKWIGLGIVSAFVIILGGIVYVTTILDPNDYVDDLTHVVKTETTIDVGIGSVNWSFFPWLGISIEDISVAHPDVGELATIKQAQLRLKVLPLLQKKIEVGTLRVMQAEVYVIAEKDGSLNFDVLTQDVSAQGSVNEAEMSAQTSRINPEDATTNTNVAQLPFDINVAEVLIADTLVRYTDKVANTRYELSGFTLKASRIGLVEPFPVDLSFNLDAGDVIDGVDGINDTKVQQHRKAKVAIDLQANLQVDVEADTAAVEGLSITVDDMNLTGAVQITQLTNDLALQGHIDVAAFNPKRLLEKLAIELPPMQSSNVLSELQFSAKLSGGLTQFTASKLTLIVDNTTLVGEVRLSDLSGRSDTEKQAIVANVSIDKINIDDYLPPPSDLPLPLPDGSGEQPSTNTASLIPVDVIQSLTIEANLRIGELIAHTIPVKDINVRITASDGVVHLSDFSGDTLGGDFTVGAKLNVNGLHPTLRVNHQLNALQLAPLAKTFAESDIFSGTINAEGDINTKGNTTDDFIANLNGLNSFIMSEGLIKGVNITQLAFDQLGNLGPLAKSLLTEEHKQQAPPAFRKDSTIGNLTALVELENGIARTKQLSTDLEEAAADGSAEVDLVKKTLAMDLNIKLSEAISNPHIAKISWPIHCEGSLAAVPNCSVETKGVRRQLEKLAKAAVKGKAQATIERKIGENLGMDLDGGTADQAAKKAADAKIAAEKARLREKEKAVKRKVEEKLKNKLQNFFR